MLRFPESVGPRAGFLLKTPESRERKKSDSSSNEPLTSEGISSTFNVRLKSDLILYPEPPLENALNLGSALQENHNFVLFEG